MTKTGKNTSIEAIFSIVSRLFAIANQLRRAAVKSLKFQHSKKPARNIFPAGLSCGFSNTI
jgi:hypothetical protein